MRGSAGHVLIVDDDLMFRQVICRVIQHDGFPAITAANASDALSLIGRSRPSLILLDLVMPEIDGLQFMQILKGSSATATIPVAIFTATITDEALKQAADLGAVAVLAKAVASLSEVRRLVRAQLGPSASAA